MTDRPILLTGSAGFVGKVIAPMLREAFPGTPVVEVVRGPNAPSGKVACDLSVKDQTYALVRDTRPGMVVHLAAYSSVGLSRQNAEAVWRDNVTASVWLARAICEYAPDAVVLAASSAEVYGRALNDGMVDETTRPRPNGPYATSKVAAEHTFMELLPQTAKLIVARPFNHTGAGQTETFAIASFAAQLARMEAGITPPVMKVGNLSAARDIMDVRDVAATYVALLKIADRLPPRSILNIARGEATRMETLLGMLRSMVDVDVKVEVDPARLRPNEIAVATAATGRLEALMPWPPARTVEETLRDVLEDKRQQIRQSAPRLATSS
ncbi:NAD-dependent epimerase/dehydratase family protein [Acuticoccus sp. I52.16.1]|uniref:NAD-dependent epimerase/dehydratase family protein n=1 Tax=Acuticoccus sp. I52.16.1 TaxID=2928472 RepID=UPI001FD24CA3|nr:NAD-dependent epimerase/dehydratase family protein [Acuticoccus sp. I52.16.1]UOM32864.1 GDP-mannose 4,6-dehydratase [Acuticoccus sp. I52.16.1]